MLDNGGVAYSPGGVMLFAEGLQNEFANRIAARGATLAEVWWRAVQQAEAVGVCWPRMRDDPVVAVWAGLFIDTGKANVTT